MDQNIAIRITNVSKTFDLYKRGITFRERFFLFLKNTAVKKFKALDNINVEIKKGELFGIVGNNGSGKSTLIQIMNKAIYPDKGGLVEVSGKAMRLALGMGFNAELTARQNIMISASVLGMSIKKINQKMDEIIEFAELEKFADNPVKYYSSGMKSKLLFSIAVNAEADIFLMDEFFGGVGDKNFKKKADEIFQERIIKGKTIVLVSHSMDIIKKYCDRVMLLEKGKIGYLGPVDGIEL